MKEIKAWQIESEENFHIKWILEAIEGGSKFNNCLCTLLCKRLSFICQSDEGLVIDILLVCVDVQNKYI